MISIAPNVGLVYQRGSLAKDTRIARLRWAPITSLAKEQLEERPSLSSQFGPENGQTAVGEGDNSSSSPTTSEVLCGYNWTTNYEKYLEFFKSKFAEAKLVQEAHSSSSSYSLSELWQLIWQRVSEPVLNRDVGVDFLALHSAALEELRKATMHGDIMAMFGIVTFSFLDVFEGPFGDWDKHLLGARALIDLHCKTWEELDALYNEVPGLQHAMFLLIWYDIMGTFISGKSSPIFDDLHRASISEDFFGLVRCPKDTFDLYIQVIASRNGQAPDNLAYLAMEQILRIAPEEQTIVASALQNAWRYGAAISALQVSKSNPSASHQSVIALLADKLCTTVNAISPTSGEYRHMACAVSILGTCCSLSQHAATVERYWGICGSLDRPIYPRGMKNQIP